MVITFVSDSIAKMPPKRAAGNKLWQTTSKFEAISKLVEKACHPTTPSLERSLVSNYNNLFECFLELCHDHKVYKNEVDDGTFNDKDENGDNLFTHNDEWLCTIEEKYYELAEKADTKVEVMNSGQNQSPSSEPNEEAETFANTKEKKRLDLLITREKETIKDAITKISQDVNEAADRSFSLNQYQAISCNLFEYVSPRLDKKLVELYDQVSKFLSDEQATIYQSNLDEFVKNQRGRINSIESALVSKLVQDPTPVPISSIQNRSHGPSHTYLKKQDPPKFNGDILDFPEFKRRWKSQVSNEKLEEQAELDRLRDNLPENGKKMLIGERSLNNAWKTLDKMFGNKTMLANKLKSKLKNISVSAKEDHEIVINLVVEVKSIIYSLTEMKLQDMLKYDDEYLAAIFRVLPANEKTKWLDFSKSSFPSTWNAMESFLDDAHERATETKVLLCNYAAGKQEDSMIRCKKCNEFGHKQFKCPQVKVGGAKVEKVDKQKLKESIGKCPLCSSYHTYKRRKDGQIWPSDRFSTCEKFRNLSIKEMAETLEKNDSCSRCLSWLHKRDSKDCRASKNSCGAEKDGGAKCTADHSKFVCGSESVYCSAANVIKTDDDSTSSVNLATKFVSNPNTLEETMMLLQDVRCNIHNEEDTCRVYWDGGSNRVLINNEFAKEQNLTAQPIMYKLFVAGGKETVNKGVMYEVPLIDASGKVTYVWGFGIDVILDPPETVDLEPVRDIFPHVPDVVFSKLPRKRVDVLVGLNKFSLHPDGGQGLNCKGELRALHSKFSHGWVIGGSHPKLNVVPSCLSNAAMAIARVCRVEVKPIIHAEEEFKFSKYKFGPDSDHYWEVDNLGVHPPKRCDRCLSC